MKDRTRERTIFGAISRRVAGVGRMLFGIETPPNLPSGTAHLVRDIRNSIRADEARAKELMLENRAHYILESRPRQDLARLTPEIRNAAAESLHRLEEVRADWSTTPMRDRRALLQMAAQITSELEGRDITAIPMRVAARHFIQGMVPATKVLELIATHLVQTRMFAELTRTRDRSHSRAHAIER